VTRPAASCICVAYGMHAAVFADGPDRQQRIAEFKRSHAGPGHMAENPPRDWYGQEAALARRLRMLRGKDVLA
jgi:hypothetical protein